MHFFAPLSTPPTHCLLSPSWDSMTKQGAQLVSTGLVSSPAVASRRALGWRAGVSQLGGPSEYLEGMSQLGRVNLSRWRHGDSEKTTRGYMQRYDLTSGSSLPPRVCPHIPFSVSSFGLCKLYHVWRLPWGCQELHCPPNVKHQVQSVTPSPFSEQSMGI